MYLFDWLDQIDKIAFTFIHRDMSTYWLDLIMLLLRNQYTWIPLYIFMVYWALFRQDRPTGLKFISLTLLCFAVTDYTSSAILKYHFERLRPCYDEDMAGVIRGLIGCGGKYSFPSSHAANHFGLTTFWFFAILSVNRQKWYWLWVWAFMIGLAQVYVGKHFPLDIVAGAALGIIAGLCIFKIFEAWIKRDYNKYLKNPSLSLP
ncbi:phosphatase PAP2 family protein [Longitalea luteola]|uniref:phosphatase PAP2 family protein n=1 Tax=Longitalea luteola TaxID=2812563 RepID=UPI001A97A453|nr:phosphatase PAP2 family protein [Longitalea luteola]